MTASDPAQRVLHMIGNSHIDPVWLWPWEEGFAEVKATFRSALDRMVEYPEFVFTCSSAAYYAWVEENEPSMFNDIRQRVAEGRWRITGGWWVEPDCNIPSGESFVRQGLAGQHYFASRFGRIATVGYNPDAFGHAGSLPQILRGSRLSAYTFLRPEPHEKELPGNLFWWESGDGARVLAFRINFGYTVWGDLTEHVRRHLDRYVDGNEALLCFYGVGNHGGGPTRANIEAIRRMGEDPDLPTLHHSWPSAFFGEVDGTEGIPVVRDELQHHAIGCYAAVSAIKRWNRQAEELLGAAERWSSIAHREALQEYPADLSNAWRPLLFNQYHDILAGTSIEPAYEDARSQIGESMAIADRALTNSVQAISWAIDTRGPDGARPIVVFNPHAWSSVRPVEVEVGRHAEGGRLLDETGAEIPYQEVRPLATSRGRHRIVFMARLPSLGYHRLLLVPSDPGFEWHETAAAVGESGAEISPTQSEGATTRQLLEGRVPSPGATGPKTPPDLRATDTTIESGRWRLEVSRVRGDIAALIDRRTDRSVFEGRAARAVVAEDASDTWGHGVTRYGQGIECFEADRVRLIDDGPLRATIRAETTRRPDGSRLVSDYTLHRDQDRIDVGVTVDWRGHNEILKLRFPIAVPDPVATWETSYGVVERPTDGAERPGQRWLDVSGADGGVSILNDGKYSSDVLGNEIGMTVLRSPIYAWHDPFVPEADGVYPFTDQGLQTFRYAILPHAEGWRDGGTVRHAAELNCEPIVVLETSHPGPLPGSAAFVTCDAPGVVIAVLKHAEEGDALVIRAWESWGRSADARIDLPRWGIGFDVAFKPWQLRTLRLEPDGSVRETDLLEGLEAEPG